MSKITLNNVANLDSWTTAQGTIDSNSATVQSAFDNTLSRDGTSPNYMSSQLDMNSNQIINLPVPSTANSPLRLTDINNVNTLPLLGIVTPQLFGALGNGINDDTAAILAAESARQSGGTLYWPAGTYKITGSIVITKAGSWDLDGVTINSTVGPIVIRSSNFKLNGGGSTFSYFSGSAALSLNRGIRAFGGSFSPEFTTSGNIASGATSFIAGSAGDLVGVNPNDWVMLALVNTADGNWLQVEYKQVRSIVGTTVNVSTPFGQTFTAIGGRPIHWVKYINPIQNVSIRNLVCLNTNGANGDIAIDANTGIIDFLVEGCTFDLVSGLAIQLYGLINPRFNNNIIRRQPDRHSAISSCQGGSWSNNRFLNYGSLPSITGLTIETGNYALQHNNNIYFAGAGGAGIIALNNSNHCIFDADIFIGDGAATGILSVGSSNNTISDCRFINCGFGIALGKDSSTTPVPSSNNFMTDNAFRNCVSGAYRIVDSVCTNNSIISLDYDSSVGVPVILDSGTGTISLNTRPGVGTQLIAPDGNVMFLISGNTHGFRMGVDSSNSYVEGVDNTGSGSYQPLVVNGSTVDLRNSNNSKLTITPNLSTFTNNLSIVGSTPASAAAAGTTGQIAWDSSFIYICTATNTWKRVAIATW